MIDVLTNYGAFICGDIIARHDAECDRVLKSLPDDVKAHYLSGYVGHSPDRYFRFSVHAILDEKNMRAQANVYFRGAALATRDW